MLALEAAAVEKRYGSVGGAEAAGMWIIPWSIGYVLVTCACADRALARQDL
jgi:hypothetical protein